MKAGITTFGPGAKRLEPSRWHGGDTERPSDPDSLRGSAT